MTHRDAPPQSAEQIRFEIAYSGINSLRFMTVGLSRDKSGRYHAAAAQDAWTLWQAAQTSKGTNNE